LQPIQPKSPTSQQHHHNPQPIANGTFLGLALIILAVMCRSWFQVSLVTYLPEWIQSQGGSLDTGGWTLSLLLITLSVGSLTGGPLSDIIGRWQVFALSLGLLPAVFWLFLTTSGLWQLAALSVSGVLIGSTFPVGLVLGQETWPNRVGLASALVMGLGWAPGGIGASVTGLVADQFSLTTGLQTLILPPLVGVGCIIAYVALLRRQKLRERWRVGMMEG
jgi:FSR family fosmidomycin resistance protein-like MFS transporter